MNIPNLLSAFRILLIPVFVIFFAVGNVYAAAGVVVISGISDALDGFIARRFNQESELGRILDPVADKLMQLAMAICLSLQHKTVIPLLVVYFIKELLMLIGSIKLFKSIKEPVSSKWFGKLATFVFYSVMFIFLVGSSYISENLLLQTFFVGITSLVLIFALFKYWLVYKNFK